MNINTSEDKDVLPARFEQDELERFDTLKTLKFNDLIEIAEATMGTLDSLDHFVMRSNDAVRFGLQRSRKALDDDLEVIEGALNGILAKTPRERRKSADFAIRRALQRGEKLSVIAEIATLDAAT